MGYSKMNTIKKYTTIKKFIPTEEKINKLANKLLYEPLYLDDAYRSPDKVKEMLTFYMYGNPGLLFEFKDFSGILWFVNIIPEYRADVIFKLWNKKLYGPTFARELKSMFSMFMKMYRIKRLSLQTPSDRGAALAKRMGFQIEGRQKYGFRWNGKLMTNIMLRKVVDKKRRK